MIFENVELHNVAEVAKQWNGSHRLQRVPETVRSRLNDGAKERSLVASNSEIRFVCDGDRARISLSSANGSDVFYLAHGPFLSAVAYPITESKLTYELEIPENLRHLKGAEPAGRRGAFDFDPRVFRILLPRKTVLFYSAEGNNLRPPAATQVPAKRYMAYGTSITEGGVATRPYLSYVAQTARRLGADLINLGMSGSCHCEGELIDHIAQRKDWDFATLCLSVNMVGGFTADEYRKRINYAVDTIAGADTSRPVACITILPYFVGLSSNHAGEEEKTELFRQILRDAVAACPHPNVHLIEGSEILDSTDCLSADMIHPSDYGMQRMGENLARRLKGVLA